VAIGEDWFGRLYGRGYRGALLTAFALLGDLASAEHVARDAFVKAGRRRAPDPEERLRTLVVRLARRRLRWRALADRVRRRPPTVPSERATVLRLHDPAGLPPETIASIVDIPVADVTAYLAGAGPVSWASVRQPVVTRVLDRVRLRRTRRRMLAGAAVAVLAAGAVVPLLRVEPLTQADARPVTTLPPQPPVLRPMPGIFDLMFADERHGHALRIDCGQFACDLDLVSTANGENWTTREVTPARRLPGSTGRLHVLGPDEVAVDWSPVDEPNRMARVYSADSGRTWTRVPTGQHGTVRAIPPGATLQTTCAPSGAACELAVVLPGSGRSARLATAPPLYRPTAGTVPIAGGRWWIVGRDPRTRGWALAVSADDGRTWTVSRLPWRGKADGQGWAVVAAGDVLIASVTGPPAGGMLAIFRSDDGGRSWTRSSGDLPAGLAGTPVAASDGTLLVNTEDGRGLMSRDDGRTFDEVRPRFRGYAYWARFGYVAASDPDAPVQYSTDGLRWREIRLER
jgi:DNA-directed RNA polymerase specialized sigma24 family protein